MASPAGSAKLLPVPLHGFAGYVLARPIQRSYLPDMTGRKQQIGKWILSLVSAVVISVWADFKAYNHGIFADTPFHIAVLVVQAGIVVVLIGLIARGIAADRRGQ